MPVGLDGAASWYRYAQSATSEEGRHHAAKQLFKWVLSWGSAEEERLLSARLRYSLTRLRPPSSRVLHDFPLSLPYQEHIVQFTAFSTTTLPIVIFFFHSLHKQSFDQLCDKPSLLHTPIKSSTFYRFSRSMQACICFHDTYLQPFNFPADHTLTVDS